MKRVGKILVCLAGGLALAAAVHADEAVLPGNPYAPLVVRNIFGLNPPIPVDSNKDTTPPPKITPNGIMSVFGRLQVLFKTVGAAKPGKDESYILSVGERQDEIEVTKIDEKNGIVTFNNHGTIQELPLTVATATSTSVPGRPTTSYQSAAAGNENRFTNRGGNYGGRSRGNRFGGNENNESNPNNPNGSNLRSVPTRSDPLANQRTDLTPEEQTLMIEAQRAQGGPTANILPITDATPQD